MSASLQIERRNVHDRWMPLAPRSSLLNMQGRLRLDQRNLRVQELFGLVRRQMLDVQAGIQLGDGQMREERVKFGL